MTLKKKICDGFDASKYANQLKEDLKNANAMESNPETAIKLVNKTQWVFYLISKSQKILF